MEARTHEPQRRLKYIQPFPFDQSEIIGVIKYKIGQKQLEKCIMRMDMTGRYGLGRLYMSIPAEDFIRLNLSLKARKSESVTQCAQICMII